MQQTHPGSARHAAQPVDLTRSPATGADQHDMDQLRAEVVRLRQANQRLVTRFGSGVGEDERAELQRRSAILDEERHRQLEHRAHIQQWWEQIQIAKERLDRSWAELQSRSAALRRREQRVAELEHGGSTHRRQLSHHLADLAVQLERLVTDAAEALGVRSDSGDDVVPTPEDDGPSEPLVAWPVPVDRPSIGLKEAEPGEQERFDRFFSDEIETEPSRRWMLGD